MSARVKRLENWLFGLCAGLLTAVAGLFCSSAWGMVVSTRGFSPGAVVFYTSWLLCLGAVMVLGPRLSGLVMGYMMGLGWLLAALGSVVRASSSMRWHPVVFGINLVFCVLGVLSLALSLRYQLRQKGCQ